VKKSNIIRSVSAALLALWYMISVVGFDVHHDNHDHHFYVVSLIGGISCENVHPEDECSCCHHNHENAGHHDDCTDEIHMISLTGTNGHMDFDFTPLCCELFQSVQSQMEKPGIFYGEYALAVSFPPQDILTSLCILRV